MQSITLGGKKKRIEIFSLIQMHTSGPCDQTDEN